MSTLEWAPPTYALLTEDNRATIDAKLRGTGTVDKPLTYDDLLRSLDGVEAPTGERAPWDYRLMLAPGVSTEALLVPWAWLIVDRATGQWELREVGRLIASATTTSFLRDCTGELIAGAHQLGPARTVTSSDPGDYLDLATEGAF